MFFFLKYTLDTVIGTPGNSSLESKISLKYIPIHINKKNKLQHIQLSDTTGTLNGTGFYGQMKYKNEFFSSKHSRSVWWTRDKTYPLFTT